MKHVCMLLILYLALVHGAWAAGAHSLNDYQAERQVAELSRDWVMEHRTQCGDVLVIAYVSPYQQTSTAIAYVYEGAIVAFDLVTPGRDQFTAAVRHAQGWWYSESATTKEYQDQLIEVIDGNGLSKWFLYLCAFPVYAKYR